MDQKVSPATLDARSLPAVTEAAFAALGPAFFTRLSPQPVPAPYWVARSPDMARELGWAEDWWRPDAALELFSGNRLPAGSRPLASVYSGHQFGVWAGQLGDGRAILLGETRDRNDQALEVQLKGSGLTPYSRMGDGRAVLRSSIREFLCSEALHGLGIPTTRALCLTGSDLPVRRETLETAAVVTRLAPSFIRFGHFEHFSHHGLPEPLRQLTDFVIDHHYPDCHAAANPPAALLEAVTRRTAALMAQWQAVGFSHGVMNTDNMSILGLTIDYGPFQFLDGFDPGHIPNHSDHEGRYAFGRQPAVARWNLFALGQALLPLIGAEDATLAALEPYLGVFEAEYARCLAAKLGFAQASGRTTELAQGLLQLMATEHTDYTLAWRALSRHMAGGPQEDLRAHFIDQAALGAWLGDYQALARQAGAEHSPEHMLRTNPAFVLRNYMAEEAIEKAKLKDLSVLQALHAVLTRPFDEQPEHATWAGLPPDWASRITLSCSS